MKTLHVTVANRAATYSRREGDIVCGNNDYEIKFLFDAEWDDITEKTAHFKWNGQHFDVEFAGDTCPVPIITNAHLVKVGIFVDGVRATTDATIGCIPSTLCGSTTPNPGTGQNYTNEAKAAAEEAKGYAEEAQAAAEAGKAIIVTVDGTTPSHTSQEIHAAISEGKLVYRHLWGSTYIPCMRSSPNEAYFVSSTPTTPAVVDGEQYPMTSIGIWAIKGNKTETVTVPVANREYVDTLFGKAMECVGSITLAVSYDVSINGESRDVYYHLGNCTTMNRLEGFQYSETDPIVALKECDILKIELTDAYGGENVTRYGIGSSGNMADLFFGNLYGMEVFFLSMQLGDMLFKSYEQYGEPSYTNVIITGYKLPKA